ncbi:MAG: hypothetical protein RLZZ396_887 [Planctomycetota bacterium]
MAKKKAAVTKVVRESKISRKVSKKKTVRKDTRKPTQIQICATVTTESYNVVLSPSPTKEFEDSATIPFPTVKDNRDGSFEIEVIQGSYLDFGYLVSDGDYSNCKPFSIEPDTSSNCKKATLKLTGKYKATTFRDLVVTILVRKKPRQNLA